MSLKIEKEIKLDFEPCLLSFHDNLYVGGEDGSIQSLSQDLTPNCKWQAHGVQVFALVAGKGNIYSVSNDGGISVWSTNGEKQNELNIIGGDVGALKIYDKELFAGDENGNVAIYVNNDLKAMYNMLEEVKDLAYHPPLLFTVRDLDITVTEINPDDGKLKFAIRHSMEGRAPICLTEKYIFAMARNGNSVLMRENSYDSKFANIQELQVSDMIVTGLASDPQGATLWTCGWDKQVKRWKIEDGKLSAGGTIDLGSCVNSIAVISPDIAYVAVAGGRVVKIKA